jgi:hypothetical protein
MEDMSQREILFEDRDSGIAIEDPRVSTCGRFMVNPFDHYGIGWIEYTTDVRQRISQAFPELV